MYYFVLTHWGRVMHICVSDLTSIGSDNGLSPGRRQAIIRTNAGILLIRPLGTNFSDFLVEILMFSFKKMRLKVSSAKRRPFCLGLSELKRHENMSRCTDYRVNANNERPFSNRGPQNLTDSFHHPLRWPACYPRDQDPSVKRLSYRAIWKICIDRHPVNMP